MASREAGPDDTRRPLLRLPGDPAAAVRHAERLYLGDHVEAALPWLRRARLMAPASALALHSAALAARRGGNPAAAVRLFRAELVSAPASPKALLRMIGDLDGLDRRSEGSAAARWLEPLGASSPPAAARAAAGRLHAATDWPCVASAIDRMAPQTAALPETGDALWSAFNRLGGGAAAADAWARLADRAGMAGGPRAAAAVAGLAALPTGRAVAVWNAMPEPERAAAAVMVRKQVPVLRPLAEAALAAAIPAPGGTLASVFRAAALVAVDVGARGLPLGDAPLLPAVAIVVAVDSDDAAVRDLARLVGATAGWPDVRSVTATVAERAGRRCLHLTRQPGLSSLLEPEPEAASIYGLERELAVLERRPVEASPLAAVLQPLAVPPPSHLKLDTQGTELEVLRGGDALVRGHLLSVQVEAEFRSLYRGQPLFGEVDRFLVERGFEVALLRRNRRRLAGGDPTVPSRLETGWCHALYVRSLRSFLDGRPDWPRVVRYCAIAMAYRLTDRALLLLDQPAVRGRHPDAAGLAAALRDMARAWPERGDDRRHPVLKDRW